MLTVTSSYKPKYVALQGCFHLDECLPKQTLHGYYFGVQQSSKDVWPPMDQLFFVEWQPSYSVGNQVLDEQHKKLLGLCKKAVLCMSDSSPEGVRLFHDILGELSDYVRTHFRTEEALMKECGYPQLAQHQREHDKYHDRLTDFLVMASRGDINRDGLHHYLSNWWSEHIQGSDMQYVTSIKATPIAPRR